MRCLKRACHRIDASDPMAHGEFSAGHHAPQDSQNRKPSPIWHQRALGRTVGRAKGGKKCCFLQEKPLVRARRGAQKIVKKLSRCFAVSFCNFLVLGSITNAAEHFLSPHGSDRNPGTSQQPFASLAGARDALHELKKAQALPEGGVTVWIGEGGITSARRWCLTLKTTARPTSGYSALPSPIGIRQSAAA